MRLAYSTGNAIVDEVSEMNLTGNVVPLAWFKTMVGDSGKPMLLAIDLLADIVYWYRPKEIRDEGTGDLIGFQKRFKRNLERRASSMANLSPAKSHGYYCKRDNQFHEYKNEMYMNGDAIPNLIHYVTRTGDRIDRADELIGWGAASCCYLVTPDDCITFFLQIQNSARRDRNIKSKASKRINFGSWNRYRKYYTVRQGF